MEIGTVIIACAIAAIAVLISWIGLVAGSQTIQLLRRSTGANPPVPRLWRGYWNAFGILAISPAIRAGLSDKYFFEILTRDPLVWQLTGAVLIGIGCGYFRANVFVWKIALVAAILTAPLTYYGFWTQSTLARYLILIGYGFLLIIYGYLIYLMFRSTLRQKDELVTDVGDPLLGTQIRHSADFLALDANVLTEAYIYSPKKLVRGFVVGGPTVGGLVRPEGLMIRLEVQSPDPAETLPGHAVASRAIWMLVQWENLQVIHFDKIIGHREAKYRLKHSGRELVLEWPPEDIEKYIVGSADGAAQSGNCFASVP